ncbi:MAG: exodeoxyribonuclease VII small subunit [Alphaproteobacteria bacterium]|nr:exodeoxyribonuclease VII small subunit [Alphaproteobacteria bacterium]MBR6730944.1 exodeoxyribonuclease VII small subunit [Alphaproteobacteria bacterium]
MTENLKNLSFEEALQELETVVRQLETGKVKLDDAVQAYEKGVMLKNLCEEKLKNAKSKIDILVIDNNSTPTQMEDFDENING